MLPRRLHVLDVRVPDERRAGLDHGRAGDALRPEPAHVDADAEPLVAPADLREDLPGALLRVVLDVEADSVLAAEGGRLLRGVVPQAAVDVRDAEPLADPERLRAQAPGVGDGHQAVVVEDPLPPPRLRLVERLGGGVGFPDLDRLEPRGRDLLADGPPGRLVGGGDRLVVLVHPVAELVAIAAHPRHQVGRVEGHVLRRRGAREERPRRAQGESRSPAGRREKGPAGERRRRLAGPFGHRTLPVARILAPRAPAGATNPRPRPSGRYSRIPRSPSLPDSSVSSGRRGSP